MALADEAEERERSRLQRAVAALEDDVMQPLASTFELRLFSFADTVSPLSSLDAIPPPGPQTRIGDAITNIVQHAASLPLAGIVLISDGAENADSLTEEKLAERLRKMDTDLIEISTAQHETIDAPAIPCPAIRSACEGVPRAATPQC